MYKHMKTVKVELNNKTVNIDKPIASDILKLNNKGYKTLYCCAGHKKKGFDKTKLIYDFYVVIKFNAEDNYKKIKIINNMPKHLMIEIIYPLKDDNIRFILRPSYIYKNRFSHKELTKISRKEFHKLVESL